MGTSGLQGWDQHPWAQRFIPQAGFWGAPSLTTLMHPMTRDGVLPVCPLAGAGLGTGHGAVRQGRPLRFSWACVIESQPHSPLGAPVFYKLQLSPTGPSEATGFTQVLAFQSARPLSAEQC